MNRLTEKGMYSELYDSKYATECINKLGKIEDLLEKYEIEDLTELEIALDQYFHRADGVQTRRKEDRSE